MTVILLRHGRSTSNTAGVLAQEHGGDVLWLACTHGDVIKSVIADAYGIHLDGFQRVTADPASVSVVRYTPLRPFVLHVNHTGARLSAALRAAPPPKTEPNTCLLYTSPSPRD